MVRERGKWDDLKSRTQQISKIITIRGARNPSETMTAKCIEMSERHQRSQEESSRDIRRKTGDSKLYGAFSFLGLRLLSDFAQSTT